jgi:hypothetical protein
MRRMWLTVAGVLVVVLATVLSGCGPSAPTASATLSSFLAAWGRGGWTAMRRQVAAPPPDFRSVNAAAFAALGVTRATFTAGRVITAASGQTARARVTEHFDLPHAGAWNPVTTVRLTDRSGTWRIAWSPKTINPALGTGDTLAVARAAPP